MKPFFSTAMLIGLLASAMSCTGYINVKNKGTASVSAKYDGNSIDVEPNGSGKLSVSLNLFEAARTVSVDGTGDFAWPFDENKTRGPKKVTVKPGETTDLEVIDEAGLLTLSSQAPETAGIEISTNSNTFSPSVGYSLVTGTNYKYTLKDATYHLRVSFSGSTNRYIKYNLKIATGTRTTVTITSNSVN